MRVTSIFERDGRFLATLTLAVTMFFDPREVNKNLELMLHQILQHIAPFATWYRMDEMFFNRHVDHSRLVEQHEYVKGASHSKSECFLMMDSGLSLNSVGSWSLKFWNPQEYGGELLGYVQLHMPYNDRNSILLSGLLAEWTEKVNFSHGYAGLAVNFDQGDLDPDRDIAMRGYCERYLGVNLSDLVTEVDALREHVKGASWVTFIGQKLLNRHQEGKRSLSLASGTTATAQGTLVQACDVPLLGDRNRQADLTSYKRVNAMLAPWLVDALYPMPGFPDEETARSWLHRLRPIEE